ncbi:hypothetical protein [Brucella pseudogrignonensis]|uniref:hypothetical protein n=1 Tax=Brucella pseudogrignonensis TaxID=419475 RepID=UPI0038D23260
MKPCGIYLRSGVSAVGILLFLVVTSVAGPVEDREEASKIGVQLDVSILRHSFPLQSVKTLTPWSQGTVISYRGVRLLDVLEAANLSTRMSVEVHAANGFVVGIAMNDIRKYQPILATDLSCCAGTTEPPCAADAYRPLGISDYGPIFLIWPSNSASSIGMSDYSKWVWFVSLLKPAEKRTYTTGQGN